MKLLTVPVLAVAVSGCSPFEIKTLRAQDWAVDELSCYGENVGYIRWENGSEVNVKVGEVSDRSGLTRSNLADVLETVMDAWQPLLEEFDIKLNVDEGDSSYADISCYDLYGDQSVIEEEGDVVVCVSYAGGDVSFGASEFAVDGEEESFVLANPFNPDRYIYGATVRLPYDYSVLEDDIRRLEVLRVLVSHEIGHALGLKHSLMADTLMWESAIPATDDAYIPNPDTEGHGIDCVYHDKCRDEIEVEESED